MKLGWLFVFALGAAAVRPASAQISVYADLSASKFTGGLSTTTTTVLYGPTIGLTAQVASLKRVRLYGDVRTGFYNNGIHFNEAAIGPKIGLAAKKFEAYGEMLVGFARYDNGAGNASTDAQTEANFGLDRQLSRVVDWRVFEFGYQQYYGLGASSTRRRSARGSWSIWGRDKGSES